MGFGKDAEEKLLGYVKEVQAHISNGDEPDDAIVKVARDNGIANDLLPLIVQAHNVGRQTFQREKCSNQGVLCKLADFPIARIETVRSRLYPQTVTPSSVLKQASAVSAEYSAPPSIPVRAYATPREKQASVSLPAEMTKTPDREYGDPKTKVARMQTAKLAIAREVDNAKMAEIQAKDRFVAGMELVARYFKQADYNRLPLAEVEYNSVQTFGPLARNVFDFVATRTLTKEARAVGPPRLAHPVDVSQAPYNLVKNAIQLAYVSADTRRVRETLEKGAQAKLDKLMLPFSEHFPPSPTTIFGNPGPDFSGRSKAAFLGTIMAGMAGSMGRDMTEAVKPKSTMGLIDDVETKMTDPDHIDELKSITARQSLNNLMANDEVISGYDPGEITDAYNEIIQLSPSAAIQPALLRPLLRKRLTAGSVEPFEAEQLANIEKTVRQTGVLGRSNTQGATSAALA